MTKGKKEKLSPRQYYARGGKMEDGLTPADVLLKPRHSPNPDRDLSHRANVDLSTYIDSGRKICLSIPIVSSPMIPVTGTEMAIRLAQLGGMGIIHRGLTREEQAEAIRETKSAMGYINETPPTLNPEATVLDARGVMNRVNRRLVVVTDNDNKVLGIVTSRDVKKDLAPQDAPLSAVMTPQERLVAISPDIVVNSPHEILVRRPESNEYVPATQLMFEHRIEKLIIIDSLGRLKGAITDFDLRLFGENPQATIDKKGRLLVGAAIGKTNYMLRAEMVVDAGADLLCVDVANAYLKDIAEMTWALREKFPDIPLMVGSIATRKGVKLLAKAGATSLRVGIGSGSICITRGVSGFGNASLTAVMKCADQADKYGIPIVADGGIRDSSDIAKLIAGGARAVMLGKLIADTNESAGEVIKDPETGRRYKPYFGMASDHARIILQAAEGERPQPNIRRPEGIEEKVRYDGISLKERVDDLMNGLRSGLTYGGAMNLEQFRNEVDFVRITSSGQRESGTQDFSR